MPTNARTIQTAHLRWSFSSILSNHQVQIEHFGADAAHQPKGNPSFEPNCRCDGDHGPDRHENRHRRTQEPALKTGVVPQIRSRLSDLPLIVRPMATTRRRDSASRRDSSWGQSPAASIERSSFKSDDINASAETGVDGEMTIGFLQPGQATVFPARRSGANCLPQKLHAARNDMPLAPNAGTQRQLQSWPTSGESSSKMRRSVRALLAGYFVSDRARGATSDFDEHPQGLFDHIFDPL